MEKIEITLYSFDELSEKAKERAISENREALGMCDSTFVDDEYRQALDVLEEKFGIKARDLESYGHRRYLLQGGWDELEDDSKYLLRYLDRLSDRLHKGKYYSTPMHKDNEGNWHYKHKYSKVLSDCYSCCLTGTYCDAAVEDAMNKRYEYVRKGYTIREFIDSVLDKFCKRWQEDSDYCFSDESIIERMTDNDCTFLKSGKMFLRETA